MVQPPSSEALRVVPEIEKIDNLLEAETILKLLDIIINYSSHEGIARLLSSKEQPDGSRVLEIGLPEVYSEDWVALALVTANPNKIICQGLSWVLTEKTVAKDNLKYVVYAVTISPELSKLISETITHNREERTTNEAATPSHVSLLIQNANKSESSDVIDLTLTVKETRVLDHSLDNINTKSSNRDLLDELCKTLDQRMDAVLRRMNYPTLTDSGWLIRQAEILTGLVSNVEAVNTAIYFADKAEFINIKIVHTARRLIESMLEIIELKKQNHPGVIVDQIETK